MKILNIITGLTRGGTEASLYRLILNDKQNVHIVLCLGKEGEYKKLYEDIGAKVLLLNATSKCFSLYKFIKLIYIIKEINPIIIQTWLYHSDFIGGLAAKLIGHRRIIWNIRHFNIYKNKLKFSQKIILKLLCWFSYLIPEKIISNSKSGINYHQKLGYCKKKLIYIPNGFDENTFFSDNNMRKKWREKLLINENELVFGVVARWHEHKNYKLLFSSLSKLKSEKNIKWKTIISGPGISKNNIEITKMINYYNLNENVLINDLIKDVNCIYNLIDFLILTSYAESFPNVIAESMCSETPCVSTSVGDSELIINKFGWISASTKVDDFYYSLNKAIICFENKNKMLNIKKNCRIHIKDNFNIFKMVQSYNKIWKN